MIRVVEIGAGATHELRRSVLRGGDPHADVDWSGDHDPTTVHLGVVDGADAVLAVSTWLRNPCPHHPDEPAVQLRGMATDPARRGTGIGSLVLADGTSRSFGVGHLSSLPHSATIELLWANARVEAVPFYERHGWTATGPVFTTAETGLPHRLVTLRAASTGRRHDH